MLACIDERIVQPGQPFARTIAPDPRLVSAIRHDIRTVLRRWNVETFVDDAQLLMSEVLTNAIEHADAAKDITILVTWTRPVLRVEVHDGGRETLPKATLPDPATSDRGRGLPLIDALSSAWGCAPAEPEGKYVWFELRDAAA